ncbi:MAG: hypothetical protein ACREOO_25915 [bacterium]
MREANGSLDGVVVDFFVLHNRLVSIGPSAANIISFASLLPTSTPPFWVKKSVAEGTILAICDFQFPIADL